MGVAWVKGAFCRISGVCARYGIRYELRNESLVSDGIPTPEIAKGPPNLKTKPLQNGPRNSAVSEALWKRSPEALRHLNL